MAFEIHFAGFAVLLVLIWIIRHLCSNSFDGVDKLHGKVVIVTGANSGIGYAAALKLAHRGAKVILGCRSKERGLHAEKTIRKISGNSDVWYEELNLASFESIKKFVERIVAKDKIIDVLVNNAGVFWVPYGHTDDGFELNFGVNYLGHFMLTLLLFPVLEAANGARVVTVSSIMHIFGNINTSSLSCDEKTYNFVTAYSNSKLMGILCMKEMARRFSCTSITFYSANPGICLTEIGKDSWLIGGWIFRALTFPLKLVLFKSASQGADTVVYCACSKDISSQTGLYYSGCQEGSAFLGASAADEARKLFTLSLELTGLRDIKAANAACIYG